MDATGEYFSVLALKRLAQFLHSQIHFAAEMLTASSAKIDCIISTCFTCPVTSNFGTKNNTSVLRYLIGIISSHTKCLMQLSWKYFFFVQKKTQDFKADFVHPYFSFGKFRSQVSAILTVFIHPFPQTVHKNAETQTQAIIRLLKFLLIPF